MKGLGIRGHDTERGSPVWLTLSFVSAATVAVVLLYAGARTALVVALVPAALVIGTAPIRAAHDRRTLGLILTWTGLVAPFLVVQQRAVGDVQENLLSPLNLFQGVMPIVCLIAARRTCRRPILPFRGSEPFLLSFGAVCIFSTMWSVHPFATALRAAQLVVIYLLLILLVRQIGSSSAVVRHVVGAVYVGIGCALAGLVVDHSAAIRPQTTFDFARQVEVQAPPRLQGLVPYINQDLLGFLAVIAVLSLVSGIGPRWSRTPLMQLLIGAGSVVALLLSGARTAVALLGLGLLILAVLDGRSRSRVLVLVMVAVAAIFVIPSAQNLVAEYLVRGQSTQTLATLTGRTTTWQGALAVWRQRALTGYGYYAGHRFLNFAAGRNLSNLDNMYIETLVDTGLVGLGALVVFLLTGLRRLARAARGGSRALAIAAVVAALIGAAFNPSVQTPGVALIVAGGLLLAPWAPRARGRSKAAALPIDARYRPAVAKALG